MRLRRRRFTGAVLAAAILSALSGASVVAPDRAKAESPHIAVTQEQTLPRLFLLGLALFPESWSENDVVGFRDALNSSVRSYRVVPEIFSNLRKKRSQFPVAYQGKLNEAIHRIARQADGDDIIAIFISTHGGPEELVWKVHRQRPLAITPDDLDDLLSPLDNRKQIIILSACFSGSFIPALASPNRIIMTAARADRTSFGCQAGASHTVYGGAIDTAFAQHDQSLSDIARRVSEAVAEEERRSGFSPPSEPQIYVGEGMKDLFAASIF